MNTHEQRYSDEHPKWLKLAEVMDVAPETAYTIYVTLEGLIEPWHFSNNVVEMGYHVKALLDRLGDCTCRLDDNSHS